MRRYIGMGVRLVLGGGDLGFMTTAATERQSCCATAAERNSAGCGGGAVLAIHDLFYDTRIFGSVNSLTSR
jgi:hypothetical protein